MTFSADAPRPSSEPPASFHASSGRRRHFKLSARVAAMLLLAVWFGPVTFVQTDSWRVLRVLGAPGRAAADSQVIPAGTAVHLAPKTQLKLHLRDGRVLEGRFVERTLLDPALYAERFADKARSSAYMPFALGETLSVTLQDGREWTAPFAGYSELTLLLRDPAGGDYLRVPFEFAKMIHRADGDSVEPGTLLSAFRAGILPSAEALTLDLRERGSGRGLMEGRGGTARVAVEDITLVTLESGSGGVSTGGVIMLSVLVSVVLVLVLFAAILDSAFNDCGSDFSTTRLLSASGLELTTRPFDRARGCFEGDAPAMADSRPGMVDAGPATALAEGAASGLAAR